MRNNNKVYDKITNIIIEKLEQVEAGDFKKPWFCMGYTPYNCISKKTYSNVLNRLTLAGNDYKFNAYATYNQWKEKGCQVKKGEKAHTVIMWIPCSKKDESGEVIDGSNYVIPTCTNVFNSEQVEGDFARLIEQEGVNKLNKHDPIEDAEKIVYGYTKSQYLTVRKSDIACYAHSLISEHIEMPEIRQFEISERYYSVFFHELAHSTGAENRLKRDLSGSKGSTKYAYEELVAELTAAMVSGSIGMDQQPRIDHAQYIKSWIRVLKNDNKFIIKAASDARKAADFILDKADGYNKIIERNDYKIAAE